jgi:hypothetical protein
MCGENKFAAAMAARAPRHPDHVDSPIGSPLNYPWPKIPGAMSVNGAPLMLKAINENKKWFVSRKLDGCNVCISSAGWVGSRHQIIDHLEQNAEFGKKKILQVTVEKLRPLFGKIFDLKDKYLSDINMDLSSFFNQQIILYGELILPGTSNSKFDVYKNKENGFQVGNLYVFGMGFVFQDRKTIRYENLLKKYFQNVQVHQSVDGFSPYFIVPLNQKQKHWFIDLDIPTVEFFPAEKFVDIFTRKNKGNLKGPLESRLLEGYVLHDNTNEMMKWKYPFERTRYHDALIDAFINEWNENDNQIKVVNSLEHLYKYCDCYLTQYDKIDLEEYIEQFMTHHQVTFDNSLGDLWNRQLHNSSEKTFFFNCMLEHAQTKILHQLLPMSKCSYDPKIKLEIIDYISKYLTRYIFDYFQEAAKDV